MIKDTLLPDPKTGKAVLQITVEEGNVYQVGTLEVLGNRRIDGVMATLAMVANAFADAGRPIGQRRHASGFGQGLVL